MYPVTSYTTQKVRALMATDGDVAALLYSIPFEPRAEKYRKSTIADAAGNFEFRRLPAGDYYVVCLITWEVPGRFGVETSGGVAYSRVAVAAGETAKAVVTK